MLAPSSRTSPRSSPPLNRGTSPVTTPSSVDLPTPVGPETSTSSLSSMVRSTSRSTTASSYAKVMPRSSITPAPPAGGAAWNGTAAGGEHSPPSRPTAMPSQRQQADLGHGVERRVGDQRLVAGDVPADDAGHDAGGGDHQLRARATGPAGSGCAAPGGRRWRCPANGDEHAERQHREGQDPRRGLVEHGVDADADAAQPDQHQRAGTPPLGRGQPGGAAVAAGVHAGGERERTLEGVLEHRDQQPPEPADPAGLPCPQALRGAHPAHAVGELREHGDGDDQGGADLVERGRHRAEQPLGVGQRVGRADADDERGQPQPVVQAGEQRPRGSPARAAGSRRPSRAAGPRAGRSARCRSRTPKMIRNTTRTTTITTPTQT